MCCVIEFHLAHLVQRHSKFHKSFIRNWRTAPFLCFVNQIWVVIFGFFLLSFLLSIDIQQNNFTNMTNLSYFILMWVLCSEQGEQLCDFVCVCMCVRIYEIEYIGKLHIFLGLMMIMRALTAENVNVVLNHICFLPQAIVIFFLYLRWPQWKHCVPLPWHPSVCQHGEDSDEYGGRNSTLDKQQNGGRPRFMSSLSCLLVLAILHTKCVPRAVFDCDLTNSFVRNLKMKKEVMKSYW